MIYETPPKFAGRNIDSRYYSVLFNLCIDEVFLYEDDKCIVRKKRMHLSDNDVMKRSGSNNYRRSEKS